MPEETPAAIRILPCSTTRSATGFAPSSASRSRASQWVVAGTPSSRPAAASSRVPVQTEAVYSLVSWAPSGSSRAGAGDRAASGCRSRRGRRRCRGSAPRRARRRRPARGCRTRCGPGRRLGDEDGLVARNGVEDVVRPDDVEGGEAVVEQVGDLHRCLLSVRLHRTASGARRKRARYWAGGAPTRRAKARRMVSGVPKPQFVEISSTGSALSSSSCRARSTRSCST